MSGRAVSPASSASPTSFVAHPADTAWSDAVDSVMVKVAISPSVTLGASPMDTVRLSWSSISVVATFSVAETEPARRSVATLNISTCRVSSFSSMPSACTGKVMVPLDWPA